MSVELKWKHQQETYKEMKEQLAKTKKAGYIYPPSCGKSFPVLKYLEENKDKRVIYLAPTIEIIEQFKEYIQKYIMQSKEPVKRQFPDWHFITYQGLKRFNARNAKVDIIISDELHRTGAEKWEKAFETLMENNEDADKIGITATPKRTDGKNMMDKYFEDSVVYELTPYDAITGEKTGEVVLKPSKYVRVLSQFKFSGQMEEYKRKIDAIEDDTKRKKLLNRFEKIEKAINASDSLEETYTKVMTNKTGVYIVLCKDEQEMKEAMKKAPQWFNGVNKDIYIDYVFTGTTKSEMRKTSKQNRKTMNEFKNPSEENRNKLKLLFAVDKLNEGVHINGISGLIMLRQTDSPVLYEQQIGRGFVTADKEIEETVIIDVVNNWLRFIDTYKKYTEAIEKGKTKAKVQRDKAEQYESYISYELIAEEIEIQELFKEINLIYTEYENNFNKFIKWIEEHKDEKTGEYKKTRESIYKNGKRLRITEMTKDEKEEYRLGTWWNVNSKERKIIETYQGQKIEEIPEEYRRIVEIGRKYGLEREEREEINNNFNEFIKWIENHKDEKTGEYRKPRNTICKNGRFLRITEMTKDEKDEYRLGTWWSQKPKERKILEDYQGKKIEEVPEEYRKIVEIGRKYGLEKEEREEINNNFNEFIKWIENHKDKETGEYKKPRTTICKNGKILKLTEMTKDEKEEARRGWWWNCNSKERKILKKYKNISEEEFIKLPEEIQNILLICNRYGIKPECKILSKIKSYVRDNVGTNAETRSELAQKVMEFNEHKPNKNKLGKQEIIKLIKLGYDEELISFEYQLPIEYVKECKSETEEIEK